MNIKPLLTIAILFWTVFISSAFKNGLKSINQRDLKAHIEFLASPELEGRETPYRGSEVAARYIASRFQGFGLDNLSGAPSYFQSIPFVMMKPDLEHTVLSVIRDSITTNFISEKQVFFFPTGGDNEDLLAEVVLCGYGITAPEYGYDDYAGIDVKNKIVMVMNNEPQINDSNSIFNGAKNTKYSMVVVKTRIAKEHGARALLIIQPPVASLPPIEKTLDEYRVRLAKPIVQLADRMESLPVFYITDSVASVVLNGILNLKDYHKEIDDKLKGNPVALSGEKIALRIRFKDRFDATSPNVIGFLPGMDPQLKDEYLIIGAHYDHEGSNKEGILYGADDNASGIAGLLELAQAFAEGKEKPKRSIVFIAFTGEEKGTLGSLYYTLNPLLPLDKAVAMINMDEIGRNGASSYRKMFSPEREKEGGNFLMVLYSAQTPILEQINVKINKKFTLNIEYDPNLSFYGSSDQKNFHDKGIPSIFYFTGFQPDYHTPRDTPDKINYGKMTRIVRLIYGVSEELLNRKNKPLFDRSIKEVAKKKRMEF